MKKDDILGILYYYFVKKFILRKGRNAMVSRVSEPLDVCTSQIGCWLQTKLYNNI